MEKSPPAIAKKMWKMMKICIFMLKKEVTKSKLKLEQLDLNMLLEKGKLAGESIGQVMLQHHHAAMGCHSNDVQLSYISPKAYQFSCSNTPLYPTFGSRKKLQYYNHHHQKRRRNDVKFVKINMFDMLKKYETPIEASPLVVLPGFGGSPKVRQLRVTDSPFSLRGQENEDAQVDKMAEDFISKFYKELKNQKRVAALESHSPFYTWDS